MTKKINIMRFFSLLFIFLPLITYGKDKLNKEFIIFNKSNDYQTIKDISYGPDSLQTFDIYSPLNSVKTKVIVLIHGGSWMNGDKSNMEELLDRIKISNPNYTIVNMNYTLANTTTFAFPNQFNDIDSLLNKLTLNQETYHIIPEFALIGRSAGGYLALMYDYSYDKINRVKTVCSISGPTDFTHSYYQDAPSFNYLLKTLVDTNEYSNVVNVAKVLSPVFQVSINSSPTIMFYGINDTKVPIDNPNTLNHTLKEFNVPKKLFIFNEAHSGWNANTMHILDKEIKLFLQKYF
jgi:acetyl esterase/lipase